MMVDSFRWRDPLHGKRDAAGCPVASADEFSVTFAVDSARAHPWAIEKVRKPRISMNSRRWRSSVLGHSILERCRISRMGWFNQMASAFIWSRPVLPRRGSKRPPT